MDRFLYDRDLVHESVNPFFAVALILCPLKTPDSQKFFNGYKIGKWVDLFNNVKHFIDNQTVV